MPVQASTPTTLADSDRTRQPSRAEPDRHGLPGHALAYAVELNWPVFPLIRGGKLPLIPKDRGGNGCHDASLDPDQVRAWWRRWPRANIGLACGASFWVLDVDGEEGLATLAELEDRNGWLPVGPASVTGSGGMHIPFAPDARVRNTVGKLGPGLDTRGAGGSAVAPPSIHPNGNRYAWLPDRDPWSLRLPAAPAWLLDLLDPPKVAAPAARTPRPALRVGTRYVEAAVTAELQRVATAGPGQRNSTLFLAAAALGRFVAAGKLDARDIGPALVDAALAAGLARTEAERTVLSGLDAALRGAA